MVLFFQVLMIILLLQIAIQSVTSARESRLSKKGRRGFDYSPAMSVLHFLHTFLSIDKEGSLSSDQMILMNVNSLH